MKSKGRINDYVGHRLQEIRRSKGMTSAEVAKKAGIAPGSYSCLENGWYRMNLDNLFRILQVLQVKITDVWPQVETEPDGAIDEEYLAEATREAMRNRPRQVRLDDIYEAVSQAFDIGKDKLFLQSRGWRRLLDARGACANLVKEIPYLSLTGLARSLGLSISSVSEQARRFQGRLAEDPSIARQFIAAKKRLRESFPSLALDSDEEEEEYEPGERAAS